MPPIPSADFHARLQRITRPWRWAFVIYITAMTIGTHWPNMQLAPEIPATDKTIHLAAFGGLAVLLWRTRWFPKIWLCGLLALVWAAFDETSQGFPGLNRTVSWQDMIANALGISLAVTWMWALKPIGIRGAANQQRLRLYAFAMEEMFAHWRPWIIGIVSLLTGGLIVLICWPLLSPSAMRIVILLTAALCAAVVLLMWWRLWRDHVQIALKRCICLQCGNALELPLNVEQPCPRCGAVVSPAQFNEWSTPPMRMMLGAGGRALALGVLVAGVIFAAVMLSPVIYSRLQGTRVGGWSMPRIVRLIDSLPPEFTAAVDLAIYLLLFAVMVRLYRGGVARYHDRGVRCRACGHDLRGTPTVNGAGRCGECGAAFSRSIEVKARMNTDK